VAHARRRIWWIAVPVGLALGLAIALGLDAGAAPASAQASAFTLSAQQLRINQHIAQQGVKRANRANSRLDALATGAGPAGPAGPQGPAGPGASRIDYSAEAGTPTRTVLELDGLTVQAACEAGGGGETNLAISAGGAEATTLVGTSTTDTGTDPNAPTDTSTNNFQTTIPAGPPSPLAGPSAPDGQFARSLASVLFISASHTISVRVAVIADGAADTCTFDGVAVPS
jgi:hypothetical protein